MDGLIYWGIIFLFAAGGARLVWVSLTALERKNAARKRPILPGLFIRIIRAGAIALFFTPAAYGWFPCPFIVAIIGWLVSGESRDMWLFFGPMVYLYCTALVFIVTEIFFGPAGKYGNRVA